MTDPGAEPRYAFTVTEQFRRNVVPAIFRWQSGRMLYSIILLAVLLLVGLYIWAQYASPWLVVVDLGLAALEFGVMYLQITSTVRRTVLVGSVLSTTWGEATLTWGDGVSSSTMPYSLIRRVRPSGEFAIVQMVRSPRRATFWPVETFPDEMLERHRVQFAGAGRG